MPILPNIIETADAPATTATPYTLALGQTAQGVIGPAVSGVTDKDWYKVSLVAGQTYTFAMVGTGGSNLRDTFLRLYEPSGTSVVASDDDGLPGLNSFFRFIAPTSGVYLLEAQGFATAVGQYGLSATLGNRASFDSRMAAGVIDSDTSWSSTSGPAAATVSFAFRSTVSGATDFLSAPAPGSQMTAAQRGAVINAMSMYAEVASITLTDAAPGSFSDNATILFGNYTSATDQQVGYASLPGSANAIEPAGDVWLNTNVVSTSSLPVGSESFLAILRTVGVAVGLQPVSGQFRTSPISSFAAGGRFDMDTLQYSVTSQYGEANSGGSYNGSRPDSLMLADVIMLQNIYGANTSTRDTATIYGYNSNAGGIYNFATNTDPVFCIWDGGGTDTIDVSQYSGAQTINLNEGNFSSVLGLTSNISIAFGAIIENVIGGSGNDIIIGNDAQNVFTGSAGNDTLDGRGNNDTVDYRSLVASGVTVVLDGFAQSVAIKQGAFAGTDLLDSIAVAIGTAGDDVFVMRNGSFGAAGTTGNDIYLISGPAFSGSLEIEERANEGFDAVFTASNFSTSQSIEYIKAEVSGISVNLSTNAPVIFEAGGNNITLTGGSGNNIYINRGTGTVYNDFGGNNTLLTYANTGLGFSINTGVVLADNVTLTGNGSANVLQSFNLSSTLIGGAGDDLYQVNSATSTIVESANQGFDAIYSLASDYTLATNCEFIAAIGANATIRSKASGGVLAASSTNNTLVSAAGNDTMFGNGLGTTFKFFGAAGPGFGNDVIGGFTPSVDKLDFAGVAANFAALTLTAGISGSVPITIITAAGQASSNVILYGVSAPSLTVGDFLF